MNLYEIINRFSIVGINLKFLIKWIIYVLKKDDIEILRIIENLRMYQMDFLHKLVLRFSKQTLINHLSINTNSDLFCYYIEKNLLYVELLNDITFTTEQIKALSKYWEQQPLEENKIGLKLNELLSSEKLKVSKIVNFSEMPKKTKKWKVSPPEIIHSDRKRNYLNRRSYELESKDAGVVYFRKVFAMAGSNSFINTEGVFVDEFRGIYPPDCDPRNEPIIRGVRKNEAVIDSGLLDEMPVRIIPKAFWLAGPFIGEWGHFVNTYLIKLFQYISVNELKEISILIPNDLPENIRVILRKLDYQKQCVEISRLEKIFIEDCYYFPSTVFAPTNGRKFKKRIQSNVYVDPEKFSEMFRIIRKDFSLNKTQKFPRKVLWARPNFSRRALENQTDFEQLVSRFGFSTFDPLKADALDQFHILYNADFICGEIGSWIYLAGINPATKIIVVMSDWDQHWWNEIGSLNKNLLHPIKVVLGKRINQNDYKSENAPHGEYRLSSKALSKLGKILEKQL